MEESKIIAGNSEISKEAEEVLSLSDDAKGVRERRLHSNII